MPIKLKSYTAINDRKPNASKLKQADNVYVLQSKADHQGSKILFADFRWIVPSRIEKVLPNNNYLVRKIGTNKTRVLHQLRRCANSHPANPCRIYKSHHVSGNQTRKLSLNTMICTPEHGSVHMRNQIFCSDYNNLVTPNSPETRVRSEEAANEMSSTPATISENSPDFCPQTDRSCDGADTDHYMPPDVDTSVEQPDFTPTNPRSSKYDLRFNAKATSNEENRYWICPTTNYGTHTNTFRKSLECVLELICEKPTYSFKRRAVFLK